MPFRRLACAAAWCTLGLLTSAVGVLARSAEAQSSPERYRFYAMVAGRPAYGFIDASGAVAIPARYSDAGEFCEGLAAAKSGGRWGWIDTKGAWFIRPRFSGAGCFSEGFAGARALGGWWGFVDRRGKTVVPHRYAFVEPFHEGRARAARLDNSMQEYIDASGNVVATVLQGLDVSEGLAPFLAEGGRWGYMNAAGRVVIEPRFYWAYQFKEGLAPVVEQKNEGYDVWSYIDKSGARAFEEFFADARTFSEGVAVVPFYRPVSGVNAPTYRTGHINRTGKPAYPPGPYRDAGPFSDGLAAVRAESGKWGFVDHTGALVIEPVYVEVDAPFRGGVARVIADPDRRLVFIDKSGKVIWQGKTP